MRGLRSFHLVVPVLCLFSIANVRGDVGSSLRGSSGGASVGAANVWTGTNSFVDGNLSIIGSVDPTKVAKFEVDGFTAGQTRIFTLPGTTGDDTIATLASAQTFTALQTFNSATGVGASFPSERLLVIGTSPAGGSLVVKTAQTPDSLNLALQTVSNSINVFEDGDKTFDFNNGPCGTSACVDPTLIIHSHNQDTTQYKASASWGSAGRMIKTLTESAATSAFQVAVPTDSGIGGNVDFTVFASDGTIQQTLTGVLQFAAVAEGTTVTCPTPTTAGTALNAVTAGTLTCTYACLAGTNTATVQWNCVSSAAQTTLVLYWRANLVGAGEPVAQ